MGSTYERLHRSVECMPMVSSKFRICAFEGRVSVRLGLLDPGNGQVRQRCRTTSKPHRGRDGLAAGITRSDVLS